MAYESRSAWDAISRDKPDLATGSMLRRRECGMRELTVDLFATVDGFAKGRNSPAFFGYGGPGLEAWIGEQLATPHAVLMGSNNYRALSEIAATGADPRMD